jgi:DNA-binding transcriptional MerR regulator
MTSTLDEPVLPDKLYFRIGEVAELLGVETHVLRYWESEFKLKPHRSSSGQRLYRKQDVSLFFRVKHLLHNEGYTIAGARKFLQEGEPALPKDTADQPVLLEALKQIRQLRLALTELSLELKGH